jgi:CheY-like chemotaxis protein
MILLVDDEEDARVCTGLILRRAGYTVVEAGCAREAVDILEKEGEGVRLIVTDLTMPDGGGEEIAAFLKDNGIVLPILFISGYEPEQLPSAGQGTARFLQKPFRSQHLLDAIGEMLPNVAGLSG